MQPKVFDAEEIEIAIDACLSQLMDAKIVRKVKGGRTPSMTSVFERMFGDEHELSKMAQKFESHVVGYGGWVSFDDMDKAYNYLIAIKDLLTKMRRAANE